MKVVWTSNAEADRRAIWDYLQARDPRAALRLDRLFGDTAERLEDFPYIGHPGEIAGTRELTPHRSYRLVYEVSDDTVTILVLIHTARQWPPTHPRD